MGVLALAAGCGPRDIVEADCFWLSVCPNPVTPGIPILLRQGTVALESGREFIQRFPTWSGTFDFVVDWTHPTSFVRAEIVASVRSGGVDTDRVFASSVDLSKPQRLHVSSLAGSINARLIIRNGGPREESISFHIVLTPR